MNNTTQPKNPMEELKTVKTFDNAIDVHILKVRLEDEEIECFVFDENMVSVNPMYSYAVGGIKLKVKESDFENANRILREIDNTAYTNDNNEAIKCPHCQSTDLISNFRTLNDAKSIFALIISFICTVIPFYMKSVYKCKSCDYEFTLDKNKDF